MLTLAAKFVRQRQDDRDYNRAIDSDVAGFVGDTAMLSEALCEMTEDNLKKFQDSLKYGSNEELGRVIGGIVYDYFYKLAERNYK